MSNYKLYNILEVNKDATADELKASYRKLAFKYHPDKNKGDADAEIKFKEISNAYNILSDENERRKYDMCGDENYNNSGNGNHNAHNAHDIFEAIFRNHGRGNHEDDIFGSFGGFNGFGRGGMGGGNRNTKAGTIEKTFTLTLDDVYNGVKKDLTITVKKYCHDCIVKCQECDGRGIIHRMQNMGIMQTIFQTNCNKCNGDGTIKKGKTECKICNGKGVYNNEKKATLIIPKGVDENYKTAFQEMGEQPKNENMKAGDLVIGINIEKHKYFERSGNDLHYKVKISFIDSVIGINITIPYFDNSFEINTTKFGVLCNGKKYLIEGKGLPIQNSKNYGDLYIEFIINYPKIKKEEKLKELKELMTEIFI